MSTSARVLVGLFVLVMLGVMLTMFVRPHLGACSQAECPHPTEGGEERAPVELADPGTLLTSTRSRRNESQPWMSAPVGSDVSMSSPAKETANLGRVRLIRMDPREPVLLDPVQIENRIAMEAIANHMRMSGPIVVACKTLHISDIRRDSAVEVLLNFEDKWKRLSSDAGSAEKVKPTDADALRIQRRDDLALVMGYEDADALLAAVEAVLGF